MPPSRPRPAPLLFSLAQKTTDRLSESRSALERKAALYEKLSRGEVDDEGEGGGAPARLPARSPPRASLHAQGPHPAFLHCTRCLHALKRGQKVSAFPRFPFAEERYEVDFLMKGRQQPELDTTGMAVHSGTGARSVSAPLPAAAAPVGG